MRGIKLVLTITVLGTSFFGGLLHAKREVVDEIVVRVNGVSNILLSDLRQPRIEKEGGAYSLEEAIDQELLFQKAVERKLLPSSLDVEKHVASWKGMQKISYMDEEQLSDYVKKQGTSLKEYKNQIARRLAINSLRQQEASERVVVARSEVEKYYENNPEYADDMYLLKTAIIPFDEIEKHKTIDEVEAEVKDKKNIDWIDADWIEKEDLSEQMSFVSNMKKEGTSKPITTEFGYQLVKLVDKIDRHIKTLKERWVEIEKKIQDEKKERFDKEFIKELREKASIVYLK